MEPMPVPGSVKPILYAQETEQGRWQWMMYFNSMRETRPVGGGYRRLLQAVGSAAELNPQPLLLFSFAKGHTCGELSNAREGIVRAAKCSKDGVPCIEGTLAELLATG